VSRGTVGLYEAGTLAPRARTLGRIAKIGGVTADWLLRGDYGLRRDVEFTPNPDQPFELRRFNLRLRRA
jgi:transcriptional regulator with XRE-family HTH domain